MKFFNSILDQDLFLQNALLLKSKKFKPGSDNMTAENAYAWFQINGLQLIRKINRGSYEPEIALSHSIAKQNGKYRNVAKLTAIDTVLQNTIIEIVSPSLENMFSEYSHAYRKGRSVETAVTQYCSYGSKYSVAVKIAPVSCYDNIDHEVLFQALTEILGDEKTFATYLAIMIKIDNLLFLGHTYWNVYSFRINRVYSLLMKHGYAERIEELALGAANLYSQTKHKGYLAKTTKLRKIAVWYRAELEEHRKKYKDNTINRKNKWKIIRISNEIFAEIYDMVESGMYPWKKTISYSEIFYEPTEREQLHNLYMDTFEQLLRPRKYRWKSFLNKFKPPKRNKRKKIYWKSI